ncbi:MAG: hypothetical protein Q4D91_02630 [Lautropia sp.]|nr:hypothetical protein [Lautropia sp.]
MKRRQNTRHALAMTLALLALTACGGGGSSQSPAPNPTDATTATDTVSGNLADEGLSSFYGRFLDQEYASVVSLALDLLGMPTDLGVERIKIVEGKDLVEDLSVVDGEIRFITPADRGRTETIRMVIEGNTTRRPLEIALGSPRFLAIADTTELDDDDLDKAPVPLKIRGLGPGNSIGHEALVFELDRDIELDPVASNAMMDGGGDSPLFLRKHWQPLPSKRGFSLSHETLKALMKRLPDGDIGAEVVFNGNGKDYNFSRKWSFVMHAPVASMEGQIINAHTKEAMRELAGRKVAIRGQRSNGTRAVTAIDAEGRFSVAGLSTGSYVAELLDTKLPGFIQTVFHVRQNDKKVQVTLPYSTQAYKALSSKIIEDGKDNSLQSNPTPKQTNPTQPKAVLDGSITGSKGCYRLLQDDGNYSFGLSSGPREPSALHSCTVALTIPEGVKSISLSSLIFSYVWQNHPSIEKGHRDDSWSYRVTGLPNPISKRGSSKDGLIRGGRYTTEGCIDVSSLTKNAPHEFSIHMETSGTGNRDAISLNIYPRADCETKLRALKAEFALTNARGHRILAPIRHSPEGLPNYPGAYISLSGARDPKAWGIPFVIRYEPQDATINEIKLVMTSSAGTHEGDITSQATIDNKGRIIFRDLVLPEVFALKPFSGSVSFSVIIRGEVEGIDYTSDPAPVKIEKTEESSFTPLFHAGGTFGADRRYGQGTVEAGGDAWAAKNTLNWLQNNQYRFNDLSAQHVAQIETNGRSVLEHAGHSDGMQLDLRYADGTGGYSDRMGGILKGSHIKKVLDNAESDFYEKKLRSSPDISLAAQWVQENRHLIEREAPLARIIYAGDAWMRRALLNGEFSSGQKIPSGDAGATGEHLSQWDSMPDNVKFIRQHLHHWHISLKR